MVCVEQWEYLLSGKMFDAQRVLYTLVNKKQTKKKEEKKKEKRGGWERDFSVLVCI